MLMGDETHGVAPCSLDNIAGLESKLRAHVLGAGKQFCGAEEMGPAFGAPKNQTTGVLRPGDVLFAWKGENSTTAVDAAAAGFKVVDMHGSHFYLDHPSNASLTVQEEEEPNGAFSWSRSRFTTRSTCAPPPWGMLQQRVRRSERTRLGPHGPLATPARNRNTARCLLLATFACLLLVPCIPCNRPTT